MHHRTFSGMFAVSMLASDGWRELLLTWLPRGYVCRDLVGYYENTHTNTHNWTLLKGNLVLQEGFPGGTSGKEPACQCRRCKRHRFNPWVGTISWRRKWQPTPVFLPEKSHGQRGMVGYSPYGHKESTRLSKHAKIRRRWMIHSG